MASAQTAAPVDDAAATLGRAWTAIGSGRTAEAVDAADALLKANPRDRRAVTVKVEALAAAAPLKALDAYETWLTAVSAEDIFLLDPIARGTLEQFASGAAGRLRVDALERLARAGVPTARGRLTGLLDGPDGLAADLALARLGDRQATGRVLDGAAHPRLRGEARVAALAALGTTAVGELRRMLSDPAGPARAAAALALGRLNATEASAELQQTLQDQDRYVRSSAVVALARLGDPAALGEVQRMLESPVPDIRLHAAEAFAGSAAGPWVEAVRPVLQDQSGVRRLRAARLLAPVDPAASRAVLEAATQDENPVVRAEASRVLSEPEVASAVGSDLASLRRALRDRDPAVRLHAAAAVLELAGRTTKPAK